VVCELLRRNVGLRQKSLLVRLLLQSRLLLRLAFGPAGNCQSNQPATFHFANTFANTL